MKLDPAQPVSAIADILNAKFVGDGDMLVTGINEINRVEAGDVAFVDHPKYYDKALSSAATTVIINQEVDCPPGKALIISDDPFRDHNKLVKHFHQVPSATEAVIGAGSVVHPSAVLHPSVIIGGNCVIHAGVVLQAGVTIGDRVIIHPNTVIGADAFYFKNRPSGYDKLLSCGTVEIHDDVEIGPCCSIDRGVTSNTVIGAGTKIDGQVQIGHDTIVGKNCLMASQVGISGACVIGDNVTLWGQVGVPSKTYIGDGAVFLGQSAPMPGHVEGGRTYLGSPAGERRQKFRELAAVQKLPDVLNNLSK